MNLVVKNNGSNAMTQMVNTIKYASSLEDPLDCTVPKTQESITVTSSSDGGQTVFRCPTESVPGIASNSSSLVNINTVEVQNCSFTCTQATTYDPPTITIKFNLVPLNLVGVITDTITYPFQTAVTMRNFSRQVDTFFWRCYDRNR